MKIKNRFIIKSKKGILIILVFSVFTILLLYLWFSYKNKKLKVSFPAEGISTIVFRSFSAEQAQIIQSKDRQTIDVVAELNGGAKGYHSLYPNWKETPASKWGLTIESKKYDNVLVLSSKNEILYIHHRYSLEKIFIFVPEGIAVIKEKREYSGNGKPDLSKPK